MATFELSGYPVGGDTLISTLVWQGDTAVKATSAFDIATGPSGGFGCFTTPERFFVVLRGSDPNVSAHRAPTGGAVFDPVGGGLVLEPANGGASAPEGAQITPGTLVF